MDAELTSLFLFSLSIRRRIYTLFRALWREECGICGVKLTMFATNSHVPLAPGSKSSRTWTNASPDRLVPGRRGGKYEEGNLAFCCLLCNTVKWHYDVAEATALLAALARLDVFPVAADGLLDGDRAPFSRPEVTPADFDYLSQQAARMTMKAQQRALKTQMLCRITQSEVLGLLIDGWAGEGLYRDPTGLLLPIRMAGLDRVDPGRGYFKGNVRLLATSLNVARGDEEDNTGLLDGICQLQSSRLLRAAADGHLPHSDHYARWCTANAELDGDGEADMEEDVDDGIGEEKNDGEDQFLLWDDEDEDDEM